ncbi:MAG: glutamine synthetase, partial [Kordiimonadaceae bacterium]|nr:glutamine synthetase [Kordiimonadaceae bacterium]
EPMDKDIYAMGREELSNIPTLPGSLDEAMDALEGDHDFMLKGDVFTQDLIDTWIDYKRENDIAPLRLRPHPYEFEMYYDV